VVICPLGDYFLASFLSYKSCDLARVELNGDFRALFVKLLFRRLVFILIHLARVYSLAYDRHDLARIELICKLRVTSIYIFQEISVLEHTECSLSHLF
jgi:hypothetical protein